MASNVELPDTTAVAPWFGSNRLLAPAVAEELAGARWVGVPFAGGMAELVHIAAPTIVVNDLHRLVINLARVMADGRYGPALMRRLRRYPFHPDCLRAAQEWCAESDCRSLIHDPIDDRHLVAAEAYFVACWMGRSGKSGIDDEFNGGLSTRWNANGGDSNTRFRSAVRSINAWRRILQRCSFSVMDAFEWLDRVEDNPQHAIYCDPPFPRAGDRYKYNAGKTATEQIAWHTRLAERLEQFQQVRVVCRFYDHPWIRELYPLNRWTWRRLTGRKQSNAEAQELLLIRGGNPSRQDSQQLF